MAGGRPSKYHPEFAAEAAKLIRLGAVDLDIADFFNVATSTITNWKISHPEFLAALKTAKLEADARVEESLYHRARGYSHDAVKIFMPAGAKKPVFAPYREHYPPDSTAAIFWLKNRQPERWRDVTRTEVTGKDGSPIQTEDVNAARDVLARRISGIAARTDTEERPPKLN